MRVVLITGGARGIGRGIVDAFVRDHNVTLTYNSSSPDSVLADRPNAHAIKADLSDPDTPQEVIDAVIAHWGRLDVIVNNAGAIDGDDGDRQQNFTINVAAPMALLDAARPHLTSGAAVVNISSVNGKLPAMGASAYSASKAALDVWTRAMAKTLGPDGIRVNGVAPGAVERIETPRPPDLVQKFVDLTALGRMGTPQDIASVVRFLASDDAGFITGETITVSGGYRL